MAEAIPGELRASLWTCRVLLIHSDQTHVESYLMRGCTGMAPKVWCSGYGESAILTRRSTEWNSAKPGHRCGLVLHERCIR